MLPLALVLRPHNCMQACCIVYDFDSPDFARDKDLKKQALVEIVESALLLLLLSSLLLRVKLLPMCLELTEGAIWAVPYARVLVVENRRFP